MRTLVWFRGKDLRVADHEPLADAASRGEVIPLFVVDPYFFDPARARELPHRMQYLVESLAALAASVGRLGSRLVLVEGESVEVVPRLAAAWRVDRVVGYRWSEPFGVERDRRVAAALRVPFQRFEGETLASPGQVLTGKGTPFAVFTPFARAFDATVRVGEPLSAPRRLPPLPQDVKTRETPLPTLSSLGLVRNEGLLAAGEKAARARFLAFLRRRAPRYHAERDRLGLDGTSRVAQDLKFGTLSARAVFCGARAALARHPAARRAFQKELVWREFAHDVLRHRPQALTAPYRADFRGFPWREDERAFRAWAEGWTGYPVVDAAARQLLASGFVHNRARMIAASFLAKDLLVDFRRGEAHYMRWLTDGDWANNDLGWQWSAGCGCDAQPYFRVFHPVTQGERFDPGGAYVKRWVPELARLDARWVHRPWEAPAAALAAAGVVLGKTYPRPIVDHAAARRRFLALAEEHLRGAPADVSA